MKNVFFDVHMHAMDLSHPNLLAFVGRIEDLGFKLVLGGLAEPFLHEKEVRLLNLLTVMENDIENYFILMEYFLRNKRPMVCGPRPIRIDDREFDTIILTPLLMDFGAKNISTDTFYNMALGKPVAGQTADVLKAIRKYCEWELTPGGIQQRYPTRRTSDGRAPLFEIYPFMGLNTVNYSKEEIKDLLDRCFSEYTGARQDLKANMGTFDGDVGNVRSNVFAGIKLYPPLGFDPWPEHNSEELDKVNLLYDSCRQKQIPVTAHCSDGGFIACDESEKYTHPDKWRKVLINHPKLKLNLAHFGNQGKGLGIFYKDSWREAVISLILSFDNVYADISCLGLDEEFYGKLSDLLIERSGPIGDKLSDRLLFGTDYMINLLWEQSYNHYLTRFIETGELDPAIKIKLCNTNPARFLFKAE